MAQQSHSSCAAKYLCGTGKALLAWATDVAKKLGATRLTIEADPDAAPFYRSMRAYDVGQAPSATERRPMLAVKTNALVLRLSATGEFGPEGQSAAQVHR